MLKTLDKVSISYIKWDDKRRHVQSELFAFNYDMEYQIITDSKLGRVLIEIT